MTSFIVDSYSNMYSIKGLLYLIMSLPINMQMHGIKCGLRQRISLEMKKFTSVRSREKKCGLIILPAFFEKFHLQESVYKSEKNDGVMIFCNFLSFETYLLLNSLVDCLKTHFLPFEEKRFLLTI